MSFFCLIITAVIALVLLPEPGASTVGVREDHHCNTVAVQMSEVDFDRAGEMCRDSHQGRLASFESEESERSVLDRLLEEDGGSTAGGHFWIGLRLPQGRCSDLSHPLRGYEWTGGPAAAAGGSGAAYTPSSSKWKENTAGLCSAAASCVSVSTNDHTWTERPCSDKTDGFLCVKCQDARVVVGKLPWHFAHNNPSGLRAPRRRRDAPHVSDERSSVTMQSLNQRCSDGPCEHTCTDVRGGYACSCYDGYAPLSQDPHRCSLSLLCHAERCPITVDRFTGDRHCPDGFVESDDFCLDIDECVDGNECDQSCVNSFGSFTCYCEDGYVLEDGVKCVKVQQSDLVVSVAASISPRTVSSSSEASGGGLVWLWVVIAVALTAVLSMLVYWLVKGRRQRSASPSLDQSLDQRRVVVSVQNISCIETEGNRTQRHKQTKGG